MKKALALVVLVCSVWACEPRTDVVEGEIVQRMAHSDGALVAIVAKANYGATVPYVYRVYLQSSDSSISAEILRADRLIDIYVEWEDNNTLVIRMRCGRIFKFKNFFYVTGTDGQLLAQIPVILDTEGLCDSESSF